MRLHFSKRSIRNIPRFSRFERKGEGGLLVLWLALLTASTLLAQATPSELQPPASTSAAVAPPAEEKKAQFAGKVADPAGKPIAGATVRIVAVGRPGKAGVVETQSDAQGAFHLEAPSKGPWWLRASAPDQAPATKSLKNTQESLLLILGPGVTIEGAVADFENQNRIAGAEVTVLPERGIDRRLFPEDGLLARAKTDPEGRYRITALEPGRFSVVARAPGLFSTELRTFEIQTAATSRRIDLLLAPGSTFTGQVLDPDGKPVAAAQIDFFWHQAGSRKHLDLAFSAIAASRRVPCQTDEQGRFVLEGLPADGVLAVYVQHPAWPPTITQDLYPDEKRGAGPQTIQLSRGGSLSFRILKEKDQDYLGPVKVTWRAAQPDGDRSHRPINPPPGTKEMERTGNRWAADNLPVGFFKLQIIAPPYPPVEKDTVQFSAGGTLDLGEIRLDTGPAIHGQVLDASGQPLEKVLVKGVPRAVENTVAVVTDSNGEFLLPDLDPGAEYQVTPFSPNYGAVEPLRAKPDTEPLVFKLPLPASLKFRLSGGPSGKPVPWATIRLDRAASSPPQDQEEPNPPLVKPQTGSGSFLFNDLRPGTYNLTVFARGFLPLRKMDVVLGSATTTDLGSLTMVAGATVQARVIEGTTHKPIAGVKIALEGDRPFSGALGDDADGWKTDLDGRFRLEGMPPGEQPFHASHPRFADTSFNVEIEPGIPPGELTISLTTGGSIRGTYQNPKSGPLAVSAMLLAGIEGGKSAEADELGHFWFEHIRPGRYTLMVFPPEQGDQEQPPETIPVVVEEGKTLSLEFPLPQKGLWVEGIIRAGDQPQPGGMVWFQGKSLIMERTEADSEGRFKVKLPVPGPWLVASESDGLESVPVRVQVQDQPSQNIEIEIPIGSLAGTVIDGGTGAPLPGAEISTSHSETVEYQGITFSLGNTASDQEGRFTLEHLSAGEHLLTVQKRGFGQEQIGPIKLKNAEQKGGLSAFLFPANRRLIRFEDENGQPISNAALLIPSCGPLAINSFPASSDPTGELELASFKDGTYDFLAVAEQYAPIIRSGVQIGPDLPPVTITLARGVPLTILLLDSQKQPVPDATLILKTPDGLCLSAGIRLADLKSNNPLATGPDGQTTIARLTPGEYLIEAEQDGKTVKKKIIVLPAGKNQVTLQFP